ncbi:MAG: hypothetical protein ACYDC5_03080 [Candidatus Dormibacteria bacterium]
MGNFILLADVGNSFGVPQSEAAEVPPLNTESGQIRNPSVD